RHGDTEEERRGDPAISLRRQTGKANSPDDLVLEKTEATSQQFRELEKKNTLPELEPVGRPDSDPEISSSAFLCVSVSPA
ncbi:MAG: hypothetical protein KAI66_23370, partial [Lentisphaeria bacterium]|nr:hypothetical protein [Lentisphaeria bacterium]